MAKVQVDLRSFTKQMRGLTDKLKTLPDDALDYFKEQTPIRTGNARRHTTLQDNRRKIVADYPYSQRLDEGYSSQNRDGMTGPTEKWLAEEVAKRLKGL